MKLFTAVLIALLPCLAAPPDVDKAKAVGNPAAPIVIEVFGSFDCPHCKVLHETTIPLLVKDYVATGKVFLVQREYPLWGPYHPYAWQAAQFATAAARVGKYSEVADSLFANQAAWSTTGRVWDAVAAVLPPADQKKVQELVRDPGVMAEVQRDHDEGTAAGITATPAMFVINGSKRYPIPAEKLEYSLLKSLLDGFLKK
ncbi:Twin-arginine translocation pathway signal [Candidatus Sulfopaludibacter sp. SbA4]|nr:Twin-arginine translocation pathway signal [Candidatus Sulfopaludibacter sp. SbA4]